jgi:hypothetical protein
MLSRARSGLQITEHFPSALGVDDYMARVEIALHTYGFTGHNTIACCNLCRDEATFTLKDKVEAVRQDANFLPSVKFKCVGCSEQ